jgi:hypothetical protein
MIEFLFLINVILISRLFFYIGLKKLSVRKYLLKAAITVVPLLVFNINIDLGILVLFLIISDLLFYVKEIKSDQFEVMRLYSLLTHLIIAVLFTVDLFEIKLNKWALTQTAGFDLEMILAVSAGAVFITNDVNIILRQFLMRNYFFVPNPKNVIPEASLKAGRVIGILERIFTFVLYFIR